MKKITGEQIEEFKKYLINEEKSKATISKYVRDVGEFAAWLGEEIPDKASVLLYKKKLTEDHLPSSVNTTLASLNCFFKYAGERNLCVKTIKIQRQVFARQDRELTKEEYARLLKTAKKQGKERLCLLMQTICSTGIRVSELQFITVSAVQKERATINCKGKTRVALLPGELCAMLKKYIRKRKIQSGSVFVTKRGKPLDRSNIWSEMKKLCKSAGVAESKVFPHNLRHLFARTYYSVQKDVVRLADILGHSSVNTTRIYTMESCAQHKDKLQKLGLLLC